MGIAGAFSLSFRGYLTYSLSAILRKEYSYYEEQNTSGDRWNVVSIPGLMLEFSPLLHDFLRL
jgi:hypothetical protein